MSKQYLSVFIGLGRGGRDAVLEPPGQIELDDVVVLDGVEKRQVGVVAAGAEIGIDARGIAVPDRADDIVGETVSEGGIDALQVGPALEEVRVEQIYV